MSQTIELVAADGHRLAAHVEAPAGAPRGALVVIQTAFGVDDYLKGVCAAYAADGYVCIAPALYDRQQRDAVFEKTPEGGKAAGALRNAFVWDDVLKDVEAARKYVAVHGKVGIVGYCVGGSIVWLAAREPGFAAGSSYYGKDVVDFLDRAPRCPVQLHFGDQDRLIPVSDVEKIGDAWPEVPNYLYAAGHGFDASNPEAARLARRRTLALFRKFVG